MKKIFSCFTSAPSICQNVIFPAKKSFLNAGPKLFYLGTFGLELEKATVLWFFYISTLKCFQTKFCSKIKILRFGTKIVLIRYFRLKFQKTRVEFEMSILKFVTRKVSSKNKKKTKKNLGPKIPHLGIFGLQFSKNDYQIFNQHTLLCETIKFHAKRKKKGSKNWDLRLECWKTIVIFLINTLQIV